MEVINNNSKNMMTEGSVSKKIIAFAFPVFIGNLFQQLYNTVDSLIVGNFLDSNALAAVSSAGNLIFLLIGFFSGLFLGAGVVIANFIGAKDSLHVEKAVHTTVALGFISSLILTVIGVALTPSILVWMGTPLNVMDNSVAYFRVYFAGVTGLVMYNTFVGILQAAGDSKHPLYFLITSSFINIILDFIFIAVFHLGVAYAALATIISQFVSAFLCLRLLLKVPYDYKLKINNIHIDVSMIKKIVKLGIPSGLQNSIIGFANVVVQSYINYFGEMAMAGSGAYSKIEGFAFLPITSFTMAMTTFIGQNMGAKKFERVKKGALFGTCCSVTIAEIIGLLIYVFAPLLIKAFDSTPLCVEYGVQRARICALFYCLLAYSHAMASIFRGKGKALVPMFVMLACWCVVRVSILAISGMFCRTIMTVNWVYPITWGLSTISFSLYFIYSSRKYPLC